jgi:hypothetical protein
LPLTGTAGPHHPRSKAIYKLPGGDLEYIDGTVTELHYDTALAPEQAL